MKKVLFATLFGTLITSHRQISKKIYDTVDRELFFVSHAINEFLRQGNYLVIIVKDPISPGEFYCLSSVFNEQLTILYNYIEKGLRNHLIYYLVGNGKINQIEGIHAENRNGKIYYTGKNFVQAIHLDMQENVIEDFFKMIYGPYQMYGIGYDYKDIPMLLEILKYGGKSSFVDIDLYRNRGTQYSIEETINNQLEIEFQSKIRPISDVALEENNIETYFRTYRELNKDILQKRKERKQELYRLLYAEKLDLDEINRNYKKYYECKEYKLMSTACLKKAFERMFENYPYNEEMIGEVMNMSCYSSFSEYYTRVLKR